MRSTTLTLARLLALLLALLMLATTALVACNDDEGDSGDKTPCTEHTDADENGKCDACGETVTPPACTEHTDADKNGKCDTCGADVPKAPAGPSAEELAAMGEILKAAYELASGATMDGTHTLTGTVTDVEQTGDGEACLTFVVTGYDQYPMYCYWLKGTGAGTLEVGDTVTITGTIKNYNGTVEYDKANLDAFVKGEAPCTNHVDENEDEKCDKCGADVVKKPTPAVPTPEELAAMGEILQAAYALASGATMDGTHTLTGTVTDVEQTGDGEACLTFVITGYDQYPMYCYWLKGDDAGTLMEGDIITVTGTIKNYKGTVEYDKATLVAYAKGERPPLDVTTQPGTGLAEGYDVITIEMAKTICDYVGEATTAERYYILATIETVSNAEYGEMIITDGTNTIKVYGTYSADGTVGYKTMTDKPFKGATVLLSCTLHSFKDTPEIQNARLIKFQNNTVDESAYTAMNIGAARNAADGTKVKIEGVVARITYATGKVPSGLYLVDGTNAIYVYDRDLAARVQIGNKISLLGEKTHWILESEESSAAKYEYKGCNQIENVWLLSNDGGNTAWDRSWIESTTVKQILATPFSTDITTTIYKVNAIINKVPGNDFVNYYINDLDTTTGSYTYTQCNGGDFAWLDAFADGKVYTVYLSVINAKSTSSGCQWRLIPVAVEDDNFVANKQDAPKFFVDYYGLDQFQSIYYADPALVLNTKVSSTVYGIENGELVYTSSNNAVIKIEKNTDGNYVMTCVAHGTVTVTVSFTSADGTYSKELEITYAEPPQIDALTVAEAIATAPDTNVTVVGIVGPSLVNQKGFHLFGEDGSMIAIRGLSEEITEGISIGNKVYVKGMRERFIKDDSYTSTGQTCIVDAEILRNEFGNYEYSTAKFVTNKSIGELYALDATVDYSTTVFVVTGTFSMPTGNGQPAINAEDGSMFSFYCGSPSQYSWLEQFLGQEVTIEVAACNWNNKTSWRGCVLAVRTADGKVLNTLNFA